MKKIFLILMAIMSLLINSCGNDKTSIEKEREILDKIQEAIYMADYPVKQGEIVTSDLDLPSEYKGVKITWEATNFPEIIKPDGTVNRPSECWIESRDQQGKVKFNDINYDWPVVLEATFEYEGVKDTHKLLVLVRPIEGFTCNKYKGN